MQRAMRKPAPAVRRSRAPRRTEGQAFRDAGIALPLMAAYAAVLLYAVGAQVAPWWVLLASSGLNLVAFFTYWQDKSAAQQGRWRISENTLHLWALLGGWGGAWVAQQVLRHKSRKASFRAMFWAPVVLHCVAVGYWAYAALWPAVAAQLPIR